MTRERTKRTSDGKIYTILCRMPPLRKRRRAKKRWRAENYARLTTDIPKEMMQQITEAAASRRISKRQFILEALEAALEK